jgi:23S rRNA (adenine2503-C2)-methyltransferase
VTETLYSEVPSRAAVAHGSGPTTTPSPAASGRAWAASSSAQRIPLPGGRRLLLDLTPPQLEAEIGELLRELGERPYRLRQLREWVFRRLAASFDEMSNLPLGLRRALEERYALSALLLEERAISSDATEKFLWRLGDGREVESVLIPTRRRTTFCISSQVGCPLACSFCATGKLGYARQLTAGEIVDQVRSMLRLTGDGHGDPAAAEGPAMARREPNLVFMGMGEPLLNLHNLLPALTALNDDAFLAFGARRITVSTAGVAPRIAELATFNPQIKLAISLHAPEDALRDEIVPLNRRYPLGVLMEACRGFVAATGKRITFEYIHLPGVNDLPQHPARLRALLDGIPAKMNLIPYNPVPELPYRAPTERQSEAFLARLQSALSCSVTLRRPRGRDIGGACGQLELERHPERVIEPSATRAAS